jgi:hypothetical protein
MSAPRKRNAGAAPGGFGEATTSNAKPTGGRREVQGMRADRNACQPGPRWPEARQAQAFRNLEAVWGRP